MLVLLLLILAIAGLGFFLLSRPEPSRAPSPGAVSEGSLVNVRKVGRVEIEVDVDASDIEGNSPVPVDYSEDYFETLVERYRRKDLTRFQRESLTKELSAAGYQVVSVDEWESIHGIVCPEDIVEDSDESLDSSVESGSLEVDPDSLLPVGESVDSSSDQDEDTSSSEEGTDVDDDVEGAGAVPEIPPFRDWDPSDVDFLVPFESSELEDLHSSDSEKSLELMRFISRSRRQGLISDELVRFAEVRLSLVCPGSGMTVDRILASEAEGYVYEADPEIAALSLDQFDMYVRQVVDGNMKALSSSGDPAVSVAPESSGSGKSGFVADDSFWDDL